MRQNKKLPDNIDREYIVLAIEKFEDGYYNSYKDSTGYDILYNGKRYAPKIIIAIAAELQTKEIYVPTNFRGGLNTQCFKILKANGFTIIEKGKKIDSNYMEQIFGEIEGIKEGDWFKNKLALRDAGLHRMERHGIDGSSLGASSIVLSGGYPDDYDSGNEILYTGHGGNDLESKRQIADQSWDGIGNRALLISEQRQIPVRVIRGANHLPENKNGYVYGGLYLVTAHKQEVGIHGFKICRFFLQKIEDSPELSNGDKNSDIGKRRNCTISKIIRNEKLANDVKELYNYSCQICGIRIEAGGIPYAEAAHIKPIGRPHNGPDLLSNLLCLCPNHHKALDIGGIAIGTNFQLKGFEATLNIHKKHTIEILNTEYHRVHIFIDGSNS